MKDLIKYSQIAKTILTNGNRTAYYAVWIKFLKVLCAPIDFVLSKLEKRSKQVIEPPLILVVGIHRTGSTFVSQIIANAFDLNEIGNFNSIFWRSRYYVHKWYHRYFKQRTTLKEFKSYYGISKGLSTIGDCYEVYDQWFGRDHYSIPNQINAETEKDLQDYFSQLYSATNKPILSKNNRNTLLMNEWKSAFPNVYFVIVKRNLTEVIRSTIQASYDFFGDPPALWGLRPKSSAFKLTEGSIVEQACKQCYYLNQELDEMIDTLEESSYQVIQYEEFCKHPQPFLLSIGKAIEKRYKKVDMTLSEELNFDPFDISNGGKKGEYLPEIQRILDALENENHAATH